MAEPSRNTYALTVVLHGVRKTKALAITQTIASVIQSGFEGDVEDVQIITSHVKDFAERTVTIDRSTVDEPE